MKTYNVALINTDDECIGFRMYKPHMRIDPSFGLENWGQVNITSFEPIIRSLEEFSVLAMPTSSIDALLLNARPDASCALIQEGQLHLYMPDKGIDRQAYLDIGCAALIPALYERDPGSFIDRVDPKNRVADLSAC